MKEPGGETSVARLTLSQAFAATLALSIKSSFPRGFSLVRLRIAMLASALAGLAVVGPAMPANSHTKVVVPIKVTVVGRDYSFTFSKRSVKAGSTVVFTFVNKGETDHNLVFTTLGKTTRLIGPGKSTTVKVLFKKKGRYPYICSVPRHAQMGMSGSFLVTR
jgi:plastocyanin